MKKLAILLFGVFAFSTSAQAITWDFGAEGDRVERSYFPEFVTGVTNGNPMPTGITITATQTTPAGELDASVYMDAQSPLNSGYDGGLGVCKDPTDNVQCGSDDNQVLRETIWMDFDQTTHLTSMILTGDHAPIRMNTVLNIRSDLAGAFTNSTYDIGKFKLPSFEDFLSLLSLDIYADKISYWITDEFGRDTSARFYLVELNGTVPVPAAVWLFGTAMLGLFGMRRKSKMEALAA
jgi:hypothetical protein